MGNLTLRNVVSDAAVVPPWMRLIRFIGTDDQIHYGEPILSSDQADVAKVDGLQAKIITGNPFSESCVVTEHVSEVTQLLGPLTRHDVPTTRCIGLNYAKHSTFAHLAVYDTADDI
jgi:hypothetical protein